MKRIVIPAVPTINLAFIPTIPTKHFLKDIVKLGMDQKVLNKTSPEQLVMPGLFAGTSLEW